MAVSAASLPLRSVDGEAQGAVHFLPDEPRRAVLCRGPCGHSVREQRALLGRSLRHLRLLQLSATQGHGHSQQHPQGHSLAQQEAANQLRQVTLQDFRSVLNHTESVMICIHLFPTKGGMLITCLDVLSFEKKGKEIKNSPNSDSEIQPVTSSSALQ